jgi:hypothetical protein
VNDAKRAVMLFGYCMAIFLMALMSYSCWLAYQNGTWLVWNDFNHYGEGMIELIVFPIVTIVLVLGLPMTFRWILRD